ncbi:hypothetical protein GOBAR_DD18011 [Gossypium barbadense]|nr:hypothetical protein GOBAR_DD18011 [Gossypium barbadense]
MWCRSLPVHRLTSAFLLRSQSTNPNHTCSRLQRIRPPPLPHVSNRPSPMMNMNPSGCSQSNPPVGGPTVNSFMNQRPPATAPLSPLPPLPTVLAAAESPVSAYMRCLQNSLSTSVDPNPKQFTGFPPLAPLVSPRKEKKLI